MKKIATILFLLTGLNLFAGEFSLPTAYVTIYTNITVSSNLVASASFTNTQGTFNSYYHTFQFDYSAYNPAVTLGTNSGTFYLDSTINGTGWVNEYSNTFTIPTNCNFTVIGKRSQYRIRASILTTNANFTMSYMGE